MLFLLQANRDGLLLAAHDRVEVTGRVDDIRGYLAHATVAVAPLRIARGVQNKVLEAMAMARPVVTSPEAVEGIVPGHTLHDLMGRDGPVAELDRSVWERALAVNLTGPMLGCKHAIPHMLARGRGSIVNTSSASGLASTSRETLANSISSLVSKRAATSASLVFSSKPSILSKSMVEQATTLPSTRPPLARRPIAPPG